MLTRDQVREGNTPDAPNMTWSPIGLEYTIQVTGSTRVQERDMDNNGALLDSYACVVSGELMNPVTCHGKPARQGDPPPQQSYPQGTMVNVYFGSGKRTGALITALDRARSDLLEGGFLYVKVVDQLPATSAGRDGAKVLTVNYTPPQPGMARGAVANGHQPAAYEPPAQTYAAPVAQPVAAQSAPTIVGYDPQTGQPIYGPPLATGQPAAPAQTVSYDPQTGRPLATPAGWAPAVQQEATPHIPPAAVATPAPIGYDPQTGQPIYAAQAPVPTGPPAGVPNLSGLRADMAQGQPQG